MQRIYIAVGGPLAGIPGTLGPGLYNIDWRQRTATPVAPEVPDHANAGPVEEEIAPEQAPSPAPPVTSGG